MLGVWFGCWVVCLLSLLVFGFVTLLGFVVVVHVCFGFDGWFGFTWCCFLVVGLMVCDCCRLVVRIWLLGLLISAVLWLGDCGFVLRWC